jgi:hypothetical protein
VGRRKYRNVRPADFLTVHIPHFVVARDQHPSVFMAEFDDVGVLDIPEWLPLLVFEPFGEPLHGKSCRPKSNGD